MNADARAMSYADRFSAVQRAALAALGYRVLQHASPASGAFEGGADEHLAGASADIAHATSSVAPAAALPAVVRITGLAPRSRLATGLRSAADALGLAADADGDALVLHCGGDGPEQVVAADALRAAPRQKAALWRALRGLRRR